MSERRKNHGLILPDTDLEATTRIVSDGAFGCAGQRCLAVTVREFRHEFTNEIAKVASPIQVGNAKVAAPTPGWPIWPAVFAGLLLYDTAWNWRIEFGPSRTFPDIKTPIAHTPGLRDDSTGH